MNNKILLLVIICCSLLQACGGTEDGISSSGSSSGGMGSSSSGAPMDELNARLLYSEKSCENCHGPTGDDSDAPIHVSRWTRATLIDKIRTDMPLGAPDQCNAICAQTLADYILSWEQTEAGQAVVAINVGGDALTTQAGVAYEGDAGASQGTIGNSTTSVAGTSDPEIYRSDRWSPSLSYELAVAPGLYDLTLQFAESYWEQNGSRVFDIFVEGLQVASNIDLYAAAGSNQAHDVTLSKLPISDGALSLELVATEDNVTLSGILVTTSGAAFADYEDDPDRVGPLPLRRLNRHEYNNTVKDLLLINETATDLVSFPSEPKTNFPFPRFNDGMSILELEKFAEAANILASLTNVQQHLPCTEQTRTCAQTFINQFGQRAYRRPLENNEVQGLLTLFDTLASINGNSFEDNIRSLIEAMLQSPAFLYRWEIGRSAPTTAGRYIQLNQYEMASRLSYFIWRSMPDDALLTAAAAGQLTTESGIRAQVQRMLESDKAYASIAYFPEYWLHYAGLAEQQKNAVVYPEYTDDLKQAMLEASRRFSEQVLLKGDGLFSSLLLNSDAYINQSLAALYGVSGVSGSQFQWVNLSSVDRSGLLTRAAFLAATGASDGSLPPKRGVTLYKNMLCREVPPPPANIPNPEPASAGGTTRERFEAHADNDCAASCHTLFDDMGFAFEHYGGIGDYRTTDNGQSVDSSGTLTADGATQSFSDANGISALLAQSVDAQSCFAENWMKYALDRNLDETLDSPSVTQSIDAFRASTGNVRMLIEEIAVSRSFRYRVPSPGSQLAF